MFIPQIRVTALQRSLTETQLNPRELFQKDRLLFLHCQETAARTPDPVLANNVFLFAHRAILLECEDQGITPPPTSEDVYAELQREMFELGPGWDDAVAMRIAKAQHNFHTVFRSFSLKKQHPNVAFHSALRMYRIFELTPSC